jgi:hypothetical protein
VWVTEDRGGSSGRAVGRERAWIAVFAVFAAARVLASSALFPFFDNVDEPQHFDLVVKYSRGELPRGLDGFSRESALEFARWASPEFLFAPERFGGRFPPPPSAATALPMVEAWIAEKNTESQEPPLYYALAALWLALGRALGLAGVTLLWWLRAFNAVPAALLVWLGHATARAVFPESPLQRLGVPLLLAVFPQDAFYSIGSDALSPLCFGLAYLGIVRFGPAVTPRRAAGTGLALAAAVLAKVSNLPLVAVAGADLLLRARRPAGRERTALGVLLACAALPIAAWLCWNRARFGDWLGTSAKVARLGWVAKPLTDWWPHPLFSVSGLSAFWSELLASFWRGEFVWHGRRLTHPALEVFYWGSSAVFPAVALLRLPEERVARRALLFAALTFASAIVFQFVLSLAFDFGQCFYPSRARPFFTSGRLLGGALVPFLLLYVWGLDRSLWLTPSPRARWIALVAIAAAVTASELWLDQGPLASAYNVLHAGG